MKIGAAISGTAHAALVGLVIFSGELFAGQEAKPLAIAEVDLMSGAEFEAALSAAPEFNPDLPAAPPAPETAEDRADVKLAETDAALSAPEAPVAPDAPEQGEAVQPLEEPPAEVEIAEVGDQPAAPLAPDGDVIIAPSQQSPEIAPVAETPVVAAPAPSSRPRAPEIDTSAPEPDPEPEITAVEAPRPAPSPDAPALETPTPEPEQEPAPEIAEAAPETPTTPRAPVIDTTVPEPEPDPVEPPAEETQTTLNDPEIPAPKVAPPPPRKPSNLAEAKRAERLARAAAQQAETGATETAEAPRSTGTSQTVGRLSFRDKENLRVGIKRFFSPPQGLANAEQLTVTIRVELDQTGKVVGRPVVRRPTGRLDPQHSALMRAGMRAIGKSNAAGVFSRLPKDKYARWRLIDVTFTPKEIRFL